MPELEFGVLVKNPVEPDVDDEGVVDEFPNILFCVPAAPVRLFEPPAPCSPVFIFNASFVGS